MGRVKDYLIERCEWWNLDPCDPDSWDLVEHLCRDSFEAGIDPEDQIAIRLPKDNRPLDIGSKK